MYILLFTSYNQIFFLYLWSDYSINLWTYETYFVRKTGRSSQTLTSPCLLLPSISSSIPLFHFINPPLLILPPSFFLFLPLLLINSFIPYTLFLLSFLSSLSFFICFLHIPRLFLRSNISLEAIKTRERRFCPECL